MNPLSGLQDIRGLDAISWWPLAPAWWVLIAIVAATLLFAAAIRLRREQKKRSWQYRTSQELERLDHSLTPENSQKVAIQLASFIRRLAIQKFSRSQCAHLEGKSWLEWLTREDKNKFDWLHSSKFLIEASFAPPGLVFEPESIRKTILATKGWI